MGTMDATMAELAGYLQRVMSQNGWTQREAAERSGLSKTALTNILNDPDRVPELPTLKKLAQGFQVPLRKLIELCGFGVEDNIPPRFIGLTEEQIAAIEALTPEEVDAVLALLRARKSP